VSPDEEAGNADLLRVLRAEIRSSGPMRFDRFMELALHHPQHGYYAGSSPIGPEGDFFTASDAGHAFGRCLARQIVELDGACGPFAPFSVLEFGAGRGLLATDILAALDDLAPELRRRVDYRMVDRSPRMRERATRQTPDAVAVAPEEIEGAHTGCAIAVELFDALPVRRVRRRRDRLFEIAVDLDREGTLVEREIEPDAEVEAWVARFGAAPDDGSEAEVGLSAPAALDRIAASLERGVLIVVDYGDRAPALYGPERRRGTLLAYHRHATNEEFLRRVGLQDLTAHVNFTALEQRARETGWQVLALTTQDRFLVANGILEEFEQRDVNEARDPRRVKRRMQAMQLLHPEGMGRVFRVLLLSRGIDPAPALAGATDPFARR
jgi:SAM-dependent MidA family methyltransferase